MIYQHEMHLTACIHVHVIFQFTWLGEVFEKRGCPPIGLNYEL